jgi:CheY-like chemotaxis protein
MSGVGQQTMKRILVAEDNEAIRELVTEILVSRGFEVIQAQDGHEALQQFETAKPDLVLLDIQMPGMDGYSVFQAIRKNPIAASIPMVALTGSAMNGDKEKALALGFDAYLSKPYRLVSIVQLVNQLLEKP